MQAQEYLARWRGEFENLKVKRDGLAEELRAIYPKFEAKIADLFKRITANDAELSRLHQARSAGVTMHLLGAELVARDLERFTTREPSIARELKLPTFVPGERQAWPPQSSLAVMVAQSMAPQHDRVTRPIGQPRWRRTPPGASRTKPGGPQMKPRATRRPTPIRGEPAAMRLAAGVIGVDSFCGAAGIGRRLPQSNIGSTLNELFLNPTPRPFPVQV